VKRCRAAAKTDGSTVIYRKNSVKSPDGRFSPGAEIFLKTRGLTVHRSN